MLQQAMRRHPKAMILLLCFISFLLGTFMGSPSSGKHKSHYFDDESKDHYIDTQPGFSKHHKSHGQKDQQKAVSKGVGVEEKFRGWSAHKDIADIDQCSHGLFDNVTTFVLFMGYPRSGHTLVGSLLDAHPNCVIALSMGMLSSETKFTGGKNVHNQWRDLYFSSFQRWYGTGISETGYDYRVQHQYQGKFSCLKVVGDKKGSDTPLEFERDREKTLAKFAWLRSHNISLKFLHVLRNPFDNIATMSTRRMGDKGHHDLFEHLDPYNLTEQSAHELEKNMHRFQRLFTLNMEISSYQDEDDVLTIYSRDLISNPTKEISRWCRFFDVPCSQKYIDDCAAIIFKSPYRSRNRFIWPPALKQELSEWMKDWELLEPFSWDSD